MWMVPPSQGNDTNSGPTWRIREAPDNIGVGNSGGESKAGGILSKISSFRRPSFLKKQLNHRNTTSTPVGQLSNCQQDTKNTTATKLSNLQPTESRLARKSTLSKLFGKNSNKMKRSASSKQSDESTNNESPSTKYILRIHEQLRKGKTEPTTADGDIKYEQPLPQRSNKSSQQTTSRPSTIDTVLLPMPSINGPIRCDDRQQRPKTLTYSAQCPSTENSEPTEFPAVSNSNPIFDRCKRRNDTCIPRSCDRLPMMRLGRLGSDDENCQECSSVLAKQLFLLQQLSTAIGGTSCKFHDRSTAMQAAANQLRKLRQLLEADEPIPPDPITSYFSATSSVSSGSQVTTHIEHLSDDPDVSSVNNVKTTSSAVDSASTSKRSTNDGTVNEIYQKFAALSAQFIDALPSRFRPASSQTKTTSTFKDGIAQL